MRVSVASLNVDSNSLRNQWPIIMYTSGDLSDSVRVGREVSYADGGSMLKVGLVPHKTGKPIRDNYLLLDTLLWTL